MTTMTQEFSKGVLTQNPVFRQLLGMCPVLAVTITAINGFGMGVAALFVLLCSNIVVSLIRNVVPARVRIPAYILVIATFVTITDLVLNAFLPALHSALGIFIPLIVVNCVIMGRAEGFARKNTLGRSVIDALGMGIGFTLALTVLGMVRELLGSGSVFGANIMGTAFEPMALFASPPGAFIALGVLLALFNYSFKKLGIE
jgi:Na+-translocating ferredoxin:NAD+ oxidoreductase subunit E